MDIELLKTKSLSDLQGNCEAGRGEIGHDL